MYFMSTMCDPPQGWGRGLAHLDRGGVKDLIFCGRHKWMAPKQNEAIQGKRHMAELTDERRDIER